MGQPMTAKTRYLQYGRRVRRLSASVATRRKRRKVIFDAFLLVRAFNSTNAGVLIIEEFIAQFFAASALAIQLCCFVGKLASKFCLDRGRHVV